MAKGDKKLADIWKTQQSLTEWLQAIKHDKAEELRKEDNDKRERLKKINRVTGLPFDEPTQFEATDLADNTEAHKLFIKKHGEELCALRLIPKKDGLPKLRMRGLSIADAYEWFKEQGIDAADYRADYVPHAEVNTWGTIFIVTKDGVYGEVVRGGHHQLTQGFHDGEPPVTFYYDWDSWQLSRDDAEARQHMIKVISQLHIPDKAQQEKLATQVGAEFANDHLLGYFETTESEAAGLWFLDYNHTLGEMYADVQVVVNQSQEGVSGQIGSKGSAEGAVQIVLPDDIDVESFPKDSVLVCPVTTPAYVPVMQKAAAIVTDQGGILSHAAIVARELRVPCIVGTQDATAKLTNGQRVLVDADTGVVKVLQ